MLKNRIIPSLQIENEGLVKSFKFKDKTYIGDPINAIKIFNDKEADEIILLDINSTGSGINYELLEDMAGEAFMPLSYGGGVQNIEQAKVIFKIGIEKIILNKSAIENPNLISKMADLSGSSSVVIAINTKRSLFGKYEVYSSNGKSNLKISLIDYIKKIQQLGAGEILICDISKDGTFCGLNQELIKLLKDKVNIPLLISGGCSNLKDAKEAILCGASGVVASSLFVFHGRLNAVLINYPSDEQINNL